MIRDKKGRDILECKDIFYLAEDIINRDLKKAGLKPCTYEQFRRIVDSYFKLILYMASNSYIGVALINGFGRIIVRKTEWPNGEFKRYIYMWERPEPQSRFGGVRVWVKRKFVDEVERKAEEEGRGYFLHARRDRRILAQA